MTDKNEIDNESILGLDTGQPKWGKVTHADK